MKEIADPDPIITSFICLISAFSVFISLILTHLDISVFIFLCSSLLKILYFLSPLLLTSLIAILSFISIRQIHFTCASSSDESAEEVRIVESEAYRFVFEELFFESSEVHFHCTQNENLNEDLEEISAVNEIPDVESEGNPRRIVLDDIDSSSDDKLIDNVKDKYAVVAESREQFESKNVQSIDLVCNTTSMDKSEASPRKPPYLDHRIPEDDFSADEQDTFTDGEVEDESFSSKSFASSGSDATLNQVNDESKLNLRQNCRIPSMNSERSHSNRRRSFNLLPSSSFSGLSASMRREKEWKRTLACKLLEERQNSRTGGGIDGMDLLWETYEMKESDIQEEEKEDEDDDGQICCLQALKLSTGKMNLGMGRSNIVKISKVLRGIGWMHHLRKMKKNKG